MALTAHIHAIYTHGHFARVVVSILQSRASSIPSSLGRGPLEPHFGAELVQRKQCTGRQTGQCKRHRTQQTLHGIRKKKNNMEKES